MSDTTKVNEGWEERFAVFKEFPPEVMIRVPGEVYDLLSEGQIARVDKCLDMVQDIAAKLVMNTIKGAVKYEHGEHSVREWLDFLVDDASDTLNYVYLTRDAMRREGQGV